MNNNVYIRNKTSIKSISLVRMLFLLPLIIYGIYKNGIYLYMHGYVNLLNAFKPLIMVLIGAAIGASVNLLYEKLLKSKKDKLIDIMFSSFHIEYGVILACLLSINTDLVIYALCAATIFFISKMFKNRINIISLTFIAIYIISMIKGSYIYANTYELSKHFQLNLFDYLIGRASGGFAATHIILLAIALTGLRITNNTKSEITLYAIISYAIPAVIYAIIANTSVLDAIFLNSYLFIFSYVATDMVTSCYTNRGKIFFGVSIGILTFGLSFLNPILAPFIAIVIISLLNNLIDRKINNR